ncbi:MAG: hypothetical protein Q8930_02505 [Bacillota bacterium]|nr:hypothetical protein [Bacillota bacterium]
MGNRIEYSNIIKKIMKIKLNFKTVLIYMAAILVGVSLSAYGIYRSENRVVKEIVSITDNDAEKYFYDGQYAKAIDEYEKLSKNEEDNPMWPVKIAEIYSIQGDVTNSGRYLDKAKEIREKNISGNGKVLIENFEQKDSEAADYIVFTEFMDKDYKGALEYGQKAMDMYKNDKKLIRTMIPVYMANDNADMAKTLISNYPVDTESAYDMAQYSYLQILMDNWDEGLNTLKNAWYKDKDEYRIFDVLAEVFTYDKDKLLEKLTALSQANPLEPSYKMWMAKVYSMSGDTSDMAQNLLNQASSSDVGSYEKTLIQAAIYQNSSKADMANELLNELIQKNDQDYRPLHTAGWFYFEKKDYAKALEYCKLSILKNKQYPDNYGFLMTEILKAMGKSSEGEPFFRTALYLEPYNYNMMSTIADYYWHTTQNAQKAMEYFKLFEIVKPKDTETKYNMAMIDLNNKNYDEAVSILKKCIEIDTTVPKYHRSLGTVYIIQGKYNQGIEEIRNAYAADQEDILTLNNAGCYYIQVEGDVKRGRYNLEKAYEGINGSTDPNTKKTITDNYKKAEDLYEKYNSGNGTEITAPDFELFY